MKERAPTRERSADLFMEAHQTAAARYTNSRAENPRRRCPCALMPDVGMLVCHGFNPTEEAT